MPPGAIRTHTCLAGTLVGPHLQKVKYTLSDYRKTGNTVPQQLKSLSCSSCRFPLTSVIQTKISTNMFQRISHSIVMQPHTPLAGLHSWACTGTSISEMELFKLKKKLQIKQGTVGGEADEGQIQDPARTKVCLTCRPMTHCPAFIFSSSNDLCCLSAYFTPMSTPVWQPLVLAWRKDKEYLMMDVLWL